MTSTRAADNVDELLPTRHSLIERLRDLDDQASWRVFFDMYWKLIYGAAIRAGLSDQEAEDAVQETVIGVARKMPDFHYDPAVCSFKGWLMHITRCRIADRFRRRRPQNVPLASPRSDTTTEPALNIRDPAADVLEGIWDEEWQKNIVDVAMERVRRSANPAHYQIFHLHAVKGLGVRDVAKLTGASLAKVYVSYHRIAIPRKQATGTSRFFGRTSPPGGTSSFGGTSYTSPNYRCCSRWAFCARQSPVWSGPRITRPSGFAAFASAFRRGWQRWLLPGCAFKNIASRPGSAPTPYADGCC